ncbi:MAG: DUF115 domain-containing protein [Treponema sp.]|jgi:hypothetical protein|nr:DUF115 domain-containing protein [Treponema sp.]
MTALHSRYNPHREAERYLSALSIPSQTRCFILIEPGLGYMIPILCRRFPGARIIALHVEAIPGSTREAEENTVHWDPSCPRSPEEFLEQELSASSTTGDFGAESIRIIEWQPSRDLYGEPYVSLLSAAAVAIRRFDAERRTVRTFGRRWVRNFFKNLRLLHQFPVYGDVSVPVIVTGAGPSLEKSLPVIGALKKQHNCFIIAASSSVMALLCRGITPDLVLATDGGGWALLHLYELFRKNSTRPPAIAASLIAGLPSQCGDLPILGIADGSLWQGLILRGLGIPHLVLPQRGTVTATALDLAFALGRGKVCIAGMDLDTQDIRTHVRPYSFDRLWQEGASRILSEYSQHFFRQNSMQGGGSHQIYAQWFSAQLASYPDRLYTLGNNNSLFNPLPPLVPEFDPAPAPPSPRLIDNAAAGGIVSRGLDILKTALNDRNTADALTRELAPLLLTAGGLWEEIENLVRPYQAEDSHG